MNTLTDTQLHGYIDEIQTGEFTSEKKLRWSVNYAVNNDFMIQYDPTDGFTIPHGDEASWNNTSAQTKASEKFDVAKLADELGLETKIEKIAESGFDFYGDDDAKSLIEEL